MRRSAVTRAVVAVVTLGSLIAAGRWLWTTPLSAIPSKAAIGKLNLERSGATLQVGFIPPRSMSSITLLFPKSLPSAGEFCAHPDFPLSLRVRVAEPGGTNIIDELVTKDRMQWTNWHNGPSLVVKIRGWLREHLITGREYLITLVVDSAVADLGEAEVFLHWMDGGYVWGRDMQKLQLTKRSTE